jgi:cytoskeleton protein RodZ
VLVAPSGADKLALTISADTWADISDGNDFQMVYHLLRAGQSLELTGSAPFSVFLGNGPGVEIRINGEPVDFSARIRSDNTTRLKIDD